MLSCFRQVSEKLIGDMLCNEDERAYTRNRSSPVAPARGIAVSIHAGGDVIPGDIRHVPGVIILEQDPPSRAERRSFSYLLGQPCITR